MQTAILVLMQMFFDYEPSLKDEIRLPPKIEAMMGRTVTSVEVIWNNSLQRRFFHVPEICHLISGSIGADTPPSMRQTTNPNILQNYHNFF